MIHTLESLHPSSSSLPTILELLNYESKETMVAMQQQRKRLEYRNKWCQRNNVSTNFLENNQNLFHLFLGTSCVEKNNNHDDDDDDSTRPNNLLDEIKRELDRIIFHGSRGEAVMPQRCASAQVVEGIAPATTTTTTTSSSSNTIPVTPTITPTITTTTTSDTNATGSNPTTVTAAATTTTTSTTTTDRIWNHGDDFQTMDFPIPLILRPALKKRKR